MHNQFMNHPLKNLVLALGMMIFLALSFKLGGNMSSDIITMSQTDTVISTLHQPAQPNVTIPVTAE